MNKRLKKSKLILPAASGDYSSLLGGVSELLEAARRASARAVNAFTTATYWEVGRRIVEFEQGGEKRAGYGKALLERLSHDLTAKYGRGFARPNLIRFRQFYQAFPTPGICSAVSNELAEPKICQTLSGKLGDTGQQTCLNLIQQSGLGKAHQVFGGQLPKLLEELNEVLAA